METATLDGVCGNSGFCGVLYVASDRYGRFIQTLPVSQGILAAILILVTGTVCYDLYHGYIRKNRYILVGLFVAVASVVVESLAVYFVVSISGIFIVIGMLVLFFANLVRTISQVRDLERTRQQQELRKRRKQMETMSLQMIQTLVTTIEAKDEYTRGHSHRVAEYSALIAKELGWKQKDISIFTMLRICMILET